MKLKELEEWSRLSRQIEDEPKYRQEGGYVYLLHFDEPLHHAKHYIGWTKDLCQRMREHEKGLGARILDYIRSQGKGWVLARVWSGVSKNWERKLKNLKKATYYCPICNPRMKEFLWRGDVCRSGVVEAKLKVWTRREVVDRVTEWVTEYLVYEFGVVPNVSGLDYISVDMGWEDIGDSGVAEEIFGEEIDVGFYKSDLDDGVQRGIIGYIMLNINEIFSRYRVDSFYFIDSKDGFYVVLNDEDLNKEDVLNALEVEGIEVDVGKVWYFVEGVRWERLDDLDKEGVYRFFDFLKQWKESNVWKASELFYIDVGVKGNGNGNGYKEALEERMSLEQLYKGAYAYMRVQPAKQDRVEAGAGMMKYGYIKSLQFIPFFGTGVLDVVARVESEETEGKVYSVHLQFFGMDFNEEFDEYTPVKLRDSKTKKVFYSSFISSDTEVAVYCGCEDFRHTFSYWLKQSGSLTGRVKPYRRKTTWWKPRNIGKIKSMCKHIFAVLEELLDAGLISDKGYLKRELDLVSFWKL